MRGIAESNRKWLVMIIWKFFATDWFVVVLLSALTTSGFRIEILPLSMPRVNENYQGLSHSISILKLLANIWIVSECFYYENLSGFFHIDHHKRHNGGSRNVCMCLRQSFGACKSLLVKIENVFRLDLVTIHIVPITATLCYTIWIISITLYYEIIIWYYEDDWTVWLIRGQMGIPV